ncbi:hypothetical protein L7F22_021996 [Adiantum nelumboides]|nr:hypothetical protein [Adiantum nelumboides]
MAFSQSILCFHAFLLITFASSALTIGDLLQYSAQDLASESRLSWLFDRWNLKNGRHYPEGGSSSEKEKRFNIFKKNLRYIHDHNTRGTSNFTLGLTRFADLTNDEFKALNYFGARRPLDSAHTAHRKLPIESLNGRSAYKCDSNGLPSAFDWRDEGVVVDVKDQGPCVLKRFCREIESDFLSQASINSSFRNRMYSPVSTAYLSLVDTIGSCWAFSAVGAMESANAIATGNLVSLSEQELVSCDSDDGGCDGGWMDYAFSWVITNGGIASEDDYPYTSSSGSTAKCNLDKLSNYVVSIKDYVDVKQYDESALLCAVARQPVSIALNGDAFDFQLYGGGIYDGRCSSSESSIDHAILVVGWGVSDGVQYWIAKNSWGTSWGSNGYIYLVRGTGSRRGICGMYYQSSYPVYSQTALSFRPPLSTPPPLSNMLPRSSLRCPPQGCCGSEDHHSCCPSDYKGWLLLQGISC